MSIYVLKIIAVISLLSEHIGRLVGFQSPATASMAELILRGIGSIALPLIIFIVVEEFSKTKNVDKYIRKLLIFALVSEIPYDLFFSNTIMDFRSQNLIFTLLISVVCIRVLDIIEEKYRGKMFLINILNALTTLAFSFLAAFLFTEYSYMGVLLAVAFYLFKGSKGLILFSIFIVLGYINGDLVYGIIALVSMAFIWFYKGEKGKDTKYLFDIIYPIQLLILFFVKLIIF